jgi:hypothetical protein
MISVQIRSDRRITRRDLDAARRAMASLERYVDRPLFGRLGLLFPQGSVLADEDDVVVAASSRYDAPMPLSAACAEMDLVNHRFMYFADADDDGHGKVIYLRRDGDYGLVEAA